MQNGKTEQFEKHLVQEISNIYSKSGRCQAVFNKLKGC